MSGIKSQKVGKNWEQELMDAYYKKGYQPIKIATEIAGTCFDIVAIKSATVICIEAKHITGSKLYFKSSGLSKKADEIKLEEVGLQLKYYRRLRLGGIETLHQLLDKTDEELLSINGLGKTALKEIKNELVKLGYLNKEEECNKEEELEQRRIRIASSWFTATCISLSKAPCFST